MKKSMLIVGIGVSAVGIAIMGSVPYFYYRSETVGNRLLTQANQKFQAQAVALQHSKPVVIPTNLKPNTLIGELDIPKLSLKAPVVEGVEDQQINVAVGHLPTSVVPGEPGTSILAAHNATWFRHVDELKPGDPITVKTSYGTFTFTVSGAKTVHTGTPVKNTNNASLVLEACYPLNALYLTPYRYLVFANLKTQSGDTYIPPKTGAWTYSPLLPNGLPTHDTELAYNSLPLGKLTYTGSPSESFIQSNAPLAAVNSVVALYLAWQHASANGDQSYLQQLYGNHSNPFVGFPVSMYHYGALFDVTLNVQGDKLISATATDVVTLHHTFNITVSTVANNNQLILKDVQITPQQ